MFRTAYQRGFLTVFFSVGSKPLELWEVHIENGHISRFLDPDIKSMVLDIRGYNVSTAYMTCPSKNRILGITMPFLIMVVKNLKKYFTFEVTIMDDTGTRRRFRVSNFQSKTQILPLSTAMPMGLTDGWNQIQFNLAEFTNRAYNTKFVEVQRIQVNANIRLRRIYFAEKLTPEEELPPEYRIFLPLASKGKGKKAPVEASKTNVLKEPSKAAITSQTVMKTVSRSSVKEVSPPAPADVPEGIPSADKAPIEASPIAPVESGPEADETPVEPGPEAGETPVEPGPEAGETPVEPGPEAGETPVEAGPTEGDETPTTGGAIVSGEGSPGELAMVADFPSEKDDETPAPVADEGAESQPTAEEPAQQPAD